MIWEAAFFILVLAQLAQPRLDSREATPASEVEASRPSPPKLQRIEATTIFSSSGGRFQKQTHRHSSSRGNNWKTKAEKFQPLKNYFDSKAEAVVEAAETSMVGRSEKKAAKA